MKMFCPSELSAIHENIKHIGKEENLRWFRCVKLRIVDVMEDMQRGLACQKRMLGSEMEADNLLWRPLKGAAVCTFVHTPI